VSTPSGAASFTSWLRPSPRPEFTFKEDAKRADTDAMAVVSPSCGRVRSREDARAVIEASAGRWVLIHGSDVIGTFDSFGDAAARAVEDFGVGSYLIRTAGASTVTLPASVVLQHT
jgi:hypothetical protein